MTTIARPTSAASRIPLPILGMALFLMAETMLFAGLISTAGVLRTNTHQGWNPEALPKLPLWLTATNMAILLISGWLLHCRRLPTSIVLGVIFFIIQGIEWSRLLFTGIQSTATVYAGVFYTLIGLHALHVLAGLACLLYAARAPQNLIRLRACTMYWLFVVLVWPLLYSLVYL